LGLRRFVKCNVTANLLHYRDIIAIARGRRRIDSRLLKHERVPVRLLIH
jgi:hypothetical protein